MRQITVALLTGGLLMGALVSPAITAPIDSSNSESATTIVEAAPGAVPATWQWVPADISIAVGNKVLWQNPTSEAHAIRAWDGEWNLSKPLEPGGSVTMRFKEPGVYSYWCPTLLHSDVVYLIDEVFCVGMCGTITVE
jgi:plastocyanin